MACHKSFHCEVCNSFKAECIKEATRSVKIPSKSQFPPKNPPNTKTHIHIHKPHHHNPTLTTTQHTQKWSLQLQLLQVQTQTSRALKMCTTLEASKSNSRTSRTGRSSRSWVGSSRHWIEPRERTTVTRSSSPRLVPENRSRFSAPLSLGSRTVNWRTSSPISLTPSPIPRLSPILSLTVADLFQKWSLQVQQRFSRLILKVLALMR